MGKQVSYVVNITDYQPLHDLVLITGDFIVSKEDDVLDQGNIEYNLKYIQTVVSVGPMVPDDTIVPGDIVEIDAEVIASNPQKYLIIMNSDTDNPKFLIPYRFIRGIVEVSESDNIEIYE